eukprot:2971651-Rhodomonas_salina.1
MAAAQDVLMAHLLSYDIVLNRGQDGHPVLAREERREKVKEFLMNTNYAGQNPERIASVLENYDRTQVSGNVHATSALTDLAQEVFHVQYNKKQERVMSLYRSFIDEDGAGNTILDETISKLLKK